MRKMQVMIIKLVSFAQASILTALNAIMIYRMMKEFVHNVIKKLRRISIEKLIFWDALVAA